MTFLGIKKPAQYRNWAVTALGCNNNCQYDIDNLQKQVHHSQKETDHLRESLKISHCENEVLLEKLQNKQSEMGVMQESLRKNTSVNNMTW